MHVYYNRNAIIILKKKKETHVYDLYNKFMHNIFQLSRAVKS